MLRACQMDWRRDPEGRNPIGIAFLRILFLHGSATEAERSEGHRRAAKHVEFFLASAVRETEPPDTENPRRSPTIQKFGSPK